MHFPPCLPIQVDDFSRTNIPSIWAVGDVTNRINLTPVALMEGMAFAKSCFTGEMTKPDYDFVPSAVFSQPPLASGKGLRPHNDAIVSILAGLCCTWVEI